MNGGREGLEGQGFQVLRQRTKFDMPFWRRNLIRGLRLIRAIRLIRGIRLNGVIGRSSDPPLLTRRGSGLRELHTNSLK